MSGNATRGVRERDSRCLRPKTRWVTLSFILPTQVLADRVSRRIRISSARTYHETKLRSPADVDDEVLGWLTEAYLSSPV